MGIEREGGRGGGGGGDADAQALSLSEHTCTHTNSIMCQEREHNITATLFPFVLATLVVRVNQAVIGIGSGVFSAACDVSAPFRSDASRVAGGLGECGRGERGLGVGFRLGDDAADECFLVGEWFARG